LGHDSSLARADGGHPGCRGAKKLPANSLAARIRVDCDQAYLRQVGFILPGNEADNVLRSTRNEDRIGDLVSYGSFDPCVVNPFED